MTDRVFLDANVLFSAAWLESAGLAALWKRKSAELLSSRLAVAEARRNLDTDAQRVRLDALVADLALFDAPPGASLPADVAIVAKDAPILIAAIAGAATHLLTGDRRHFGHLYGKSVHGVAVLTPAAYLAKRQK